MNITNKLKAGYYWIKALKLSFDEEFVEALEKIESIEKLLTAKGEIILLKGYLNYELGEYSKAVEDLSLGAKQITKSDIYSVEEKEYLNCYASEYEKRCIDNINQLTTPEFQVNYDLVELNKVRTTLKKNFPLRLHPEWEAI